MSNTSAPLSLAVCIRRSWASFPHPRLCCRNFNSCLSNSEALPGRPGRSHHERHERCLFGPCLSKSGTLAALYSSWPSVPWWRISNRHSSCRGCRSPGTHGRNQGTWSIGGLPHTRGCGTQHTRSDTLCLPHLAGSLRSSPHQSGWRACRKRQVSICPVPGRRQTRPLLSRW